jgi:hypothetical protein
MAVTQLEAGAIIWESGQETAFDDTLDDCGGLTRGEKEEQSRRDAQLSLLLLAQELLEQGVPQEEVASYVFQTQAFVISSNQAPALPSTLLSPVSSFRHYAGEKPDLGRIAQLTVDEVAKRRLPPAYGPHYSPEPSTSQAGSPILAVRRPSISSTISNISTTSTSSATSSGSYTLEEEEELVEKMQQFLDEQYEANKVAILSDLENEAQRKQILAQGGRSRRWDIWRQRLGLGLVGGGPDENWTTKDLQHHGNFRSSLPSPQLDLPNNVRFLQGGGHNCGCCRGRDNQGSTARIPQDPTSKRGLDQFPSSCFATGDRVL